MKKAFIFTIISGVLWGSSAAFVKFLTPYGFPSFQLTFVRGAVSFICMALYALIFDRSLFKISLKELFYLFFVGASLFGCAGCYFTSMQMTSVSTAVTLMYTAPIYVMIFSVLFLGEKFSKFKLVSVICMLLGCCLVSGLIGGIKFNLPGIIIGFVAGISFAAYNVLTKISVDRRCKPFTATMYSSLFMTVVALFVSDIGTLGTNISHAPLITIPLLVGLGVVTFVVPYFLYSSAMKNLPVGTVSSLSTVEPMSATLFSIIIFGEKLTISSVLGILLIVLAVILLGKSENTK